VGTLLEGLHHRDVFNGPFPFRYFHGTDFLEHSAMDRLVELLVKIFSSALLGQELLLFHRVTVNLLIIVHELCRRDAERIRGCPLLLFHVQLESIQNDLVFLILFKRQEIGQESAFLALHTGSAPSRQIRAQCFGCQ
jgi:hypothetical protein